MVSLYQAVLSGLAFGLPYSQPPLSATPPPLPSKSIAIVGAGSAGIAMLHRLLEFPQETRKDWDIVLFEHTQDVGGIWLPELDKPPPPILPNTPLYPLLKTNTPVPLMTYPNSPFPPGTPLFPSYQNIQAYHSNYTRTFGLDKHIAFNHTVLSAAWAGNSTIGRWNVTIRDAANETALRTFDHVVVATGNNHYPSIAHFVGEKDWLANSSSEGKKREILHSVWYKGPERYTNRTVLVIGSGGSGMDAGKQVATTARKIYQSTRNNDYEPPAKLGIIMKPDISHFTTDGIVFVDGSVARDVESIILATGYELRFPFLEAERVVVVDSTARTNFSRSMSQSLTTNTRYLFPLHRHIVSLSPLQPPGALMFIGLPIRVPNCFSDSAQSLFAANVIRDPSLLPTREAMLEELREQEQNVRKGGWDPYWIGHRMMNASAFDYQDGLAQYLRDKGAIEDSGRPFTDPWRIRPEPEKSVTGLMRKGWIRVEELGEEDRWLEGVESEEHWANLMDRVQEWEREKEEEEGTLLDADGGIDIGQTYWDDMY